MGEMQLEMAHRGAFFFDFKVPTHDPTGVKIPRSTEYEVRLKIVTSNLVCKQSVCRIDLILTCRRV